MDRPIFDSMYFPDFKQRYLSYYLFIESDYFDFGLIGFDAQSRDEATCEICFKARIVKNNLNMAGVYQNFKYIFLLTNSGGLKYDIKEDYYGAI